jgi:hypothetical protein
MLRKLMIGAVAAVAIGLGAQSASAGEPYRGPIGGPVGGPNGGFYPPRTDYDFVVFVAHRHGNHFHWERYGRYETRREAERVERYLERQGHRVRIEEVRDRGRRPW